MNTLTFSIRISAPASAVWQALWNDTTYRQWTTIFCPGSYAETDWQEGSKVLFLTPTGDGISSFIHKKAENEHMAFRHHRMIHKGVEQQERTWEGAMETYTLKEADGKTTLTTNVDSPAEHAEYFRETWPKALEIVRGLAEGALKPALMVLASVDAPLLKVWACWTEPAHITQWCQASDDWHAPFAENDLTEGGKFRTTMAARDGSVSFDFEGVYTEVEPLKKIAYTMSDGRTAEVRFTENRNVVEILETFEPEGSNPHDMQRTGWQAILNNFKSYTEKLRQ